MSFDYLKTKGTVEKLLVRFGSQATFTRKTGGTYDPVTGGTTATTETYTRYIVWADYKTSEIDGTVVQRGDARLLVAGSVAVGDKVEKNGSEWRIIDANPVQPAEIAVMYTAQARQ